MSTHQPQKRTPLHRHPPCPPAANPVAAFKLLHRLSLFPVVFAVPPPLQAKLGPHYADHCLATSLTAADLLNSSRIQVCCAGCGRGGRCAGCNQGGSALAVARVAGALAVARVAGSLPAFAEEELSWLLCWL